MEIAIHRVSEIKPNRLTLIAGLSLLIPPICGMLYGLITLADTVPAFYPGPVFVLLPSFLIGPAGMLVPMISFFLWNRALFNGAVKIPRRSHILVAFLTVLSVPWFLSGWRDGIDLHGPHFNYFLSMINIAWLAILWFLIVHSWKAEPSFRFNLLFHWLLFAWLAWFAFPFFGDVIL
jgi:hypothetical protein